MCVPVCGRDTQKVTKDSKKESCRVRDQNRESTSVCGHKGEMGTHIPVPFPGLIAQLPEGQLVAAGEVLLYCRELSSPLSYLSEESGYAL